MFPVFIMMMLQTLVVRLLLAVLASSVHIVGSSALPLPGGAKNLQIINAAAMELSDLPTDIQKLPQEKSAQTALPVSVDDSISLGIICQKLMVMMAHDHTKCNIPNFLDSDDSNAVDNSISIVESNAVEDFKPTFENDRNGNTGGESQLKLVSSDQWLLDNDKVTKVPVVDDNDVDSFNDGLFNNLWVEVGKITDAMQKVINAMIDQLGTLGSKFSEFGNNMFSEIKLSENNNFIISLIFIGCFVMIILLILFCLLLKHIFKRDSPFEYGKDSNSSERKVFLSVSMSNENISCIDVHENNEDRNDDKGEVVMCIVAPPNASLNDIMLKEALKK